MGIEGFDDEREFVGREVDQHGPCLYHNRRNDVDGGQNASPEAVQPSND
jgi:hypothetical protein